MAHNKNIDADLNFRRAVLNLYRNFDTVEDLLIYWGYSGPCREYHPVIEDCE